jgi:hypothetical protein
MASVLYRQDSLTIVVKQMAKDAYWFRHDANARNDIKVIELRSLHGYEGYGIYFSIIEVMREQSSYTISESKIGMVALALGLPLDKLKTVLDDCISIGLFERHDGEILSQSFLLRMDVWDSYKSNGKRGGRPPKQPKLKQSDKPTNNQSENQTHNQTDNQSGNLNDTMIVNRVNRDSKQSASEFPTLEMCVQASQMDGFTEKQGEAYYHLRNSTDWLIPRGKSGNLYPVANWRSDMHNVISQGWLDKKPDTGKPDASETYKNWKPL